MIIGIDEVSKLTKTLSGKKIGLVTGCFDVLHLGHISLFEFSKKNVDILLVGIDSDKSVKINKGKDRPLFSQDIRLNVIDSIKYVDYALLIDHRMNYADSSINDYYIQLYEMIGVTHLITNSKSDKSFIEKGKRADKLGIEFILQDEDKFSSSSNIIETLGL